MIYHNTDFPNSQAVPLVAEPQHCTSDENFVSETDFKIWIEWGIWNVLDWAESIANDHYPSHGCECLSTNTSIMIKIR